jgi:hypothetical protein
MVERGLSVDHVTIWRWVQRYAPILNQRLRRNAAIPIAPGVSMRPMSGLPATGRSFVRNRAGSGRGWSMWMDTRRTPAPSPS